MQRLFFDGKPTDYFFEDDINPSHLVDWCNDNINAFILDKPRVSYCAQAGNEDIYVYMCGEVIPVELKKVEINKLD